jgi:hypothetical protein
MVRAKLIGQEYRGEIDAGNYKISYRWFGFDGALTKKDKDALHLTAVDQARDAIFVGERDGELNDTINGETIHGWWRIKQ